MYSNFDFMEQIDQASYQKLILAEKALYTSRKATGAALRDFWEGFVGKILSQYNIYNDLKHYLGKDPDLATKLAFLTLPNGKAGEKYAGLQSLMEQINRERQKKGQKPVPLFKDKNIPATLNGNISRYHSKSRDTRSSISLLWFFRQYCNDCKHEPTDNTPPTFDVTFMQTLDYLVSLHKFLQAYCRNNYPAQIGTQITEYNKKIVLLDNFEVTQVNSSPNDQFRTHCFKECLARFSPTTGYGNTFPALIRMFKKSDIDAEFASRSAGVFSLVRNNACGKGLRRIIELSGYDSVSEFYIVAYIFENEATVLNNALLATAPFTVRLEWCREITRIVCDLHANKPKIFHRLINHNCIYLTKTDEEEGQLVPSLINLCFAKILAPNAPTVYAKALSAAEQTQLRQSAEDKYISGEYGNCPVCADPGVIEAHWEKVDIFALGMLICDILCADISKKPHCAADLKAAGVNDQIIGILSRCLAAARMRPTAAEVLACLQNGGV